MAKTARKPPRRPAKSAPQAAESAPRHAVITFRISAEEAALIKKAADRIPLARYSRDAILSRAQADTRK